MIVGMCSIETTDSSLSRLRADLPWIAEVYMTERKGDAGGAVQSGLWSDSLRWAGTNGLPPRGVSTAAPREPVADRLPDLPPWPLVIGPFPWLPAGGDAVRPSLHGLVQRYVCELEISTASTIEVGVQLVDSGFKSAQLSIAWKYGPLNRTAGKLRVYTPNEENALAYEIDLSPILGQFNGLEQGNGQRSIVASALTTPSGSTPIAPDLYLLYALGIAVEQPIQNLVITGKGIVPQFGAAKLGSASSFGLDGAEIAPCGPEAPLGATCLSLGLKSFRLTVLGQWYA